MGDLWSVIIFFGIVITVIDTIVPNNKKSGRRSRKQKPVKMKNIRSQEEKPLYTIPETIHPRNIGCIKWNENFLKSLEWKRYEEVCMEYLRLKNCDADVTSIGADGGIDIKVKDRNGNTLAVAQCKSWKKPIGVDLIRQLYGVMAGEGIKLGIFLTTSVFSPDATKFAEGKNLILIDADELVNLINGLKDDDKKKIDAKAIEGDYTTPTCVHCNVKMVKRVATKGKNEGNEFWGCINFPKCKKTMIYTAKQKFDNYASS